MTEREIFAQALEIPAANERNAFLDSACGGDAALRQRIDRLLAEREKLGSYLEIPAAAVATVDLPATIRPGLRIGRYRLLEEIGEGGMGTVWVAEQMEPVKRRVALKLIKPGMDSRHVLSRFEAERQALALMDHPNIARVFDGGMTDEGRPYFVMEYVKGLPLTEYCDQVRLSLKERLKLFVEICQAVQHAHQKGIIHRDLKPSNILVCLYDGRPVPKVIDFGLAKAMHQSLTDHTLYTAHGMIVGTPLYMSPEQAEQNNLDVDTRTDIYSLGVVLYELLTGTTPLEVKQLKEAAYNEILRLLKEFEPPKPSTRLSGSDRLPTIAAQRSIEPNQLRNSVSGDLDWIAMKSLEKERSRRYETANELARDIERYLNDEAVEATPPSLTYRVRKLARRHRRALLAACAVLVTLVAGIIGTTWGLVQALIQRDNADQARVMALEKSRAATAARQEEAKQRKIAHQQMRRAYQWLYVAEMNLIQDDWNNANMISLRGRLNRTHPSATGNQDLRDFEWYYWDRICRAAQTGFETHQRPRRASFDREGEHVALGGDGPDVTIWEVTSGRKVRTLSGHEGHSISGISFSRDSARLATGTISAVRLWNSATGDLLQFFPVAQRGFSGVAVSPDGVRVASGNQVGHVVAWDAASSAEIFSSKAFTNGVTSIAFAPDGSKLACGSALTGDVKLLECLSGNELMSFNNGPGTVSGLQFNTIGTELLVGNVSGELRWWDLATQKPVRSMRPHASNLLSIAQSPDNRIVITTGQDQTIRVFDTAGKNSNITLRGHEAPVIACTFRSTDKKIVSIDVSGAIRLWDPTRGQESTSWPRESGIWSVNESAALALRKTADGPTEVISLSENQTLMQLEEPSYYCGHAWRPGKDELAIADPAGAIHVWDVKSQTRRLTLTTGMGIGHLRYDSPGNKLVSASRDLVHVWNAADGNLLLKFSASGGASKEYSGKPLEPEFFSLDISPDGSRIVTVNKDLTPRVWDTSTGQEAVSLDMAETEIAPQSAIFSPDGGKVAACSEGTAVVIWDVVTGKKVRRLEGMKEAMRVCFNEKGTRLAATNPFLTTVWDLTTGQLVLTLPQSGGYDIQFLRDDMLVARNNGGLHLWDGRPFADGTPERTTGGWKD